MNAQATVKTPQSIIYRLETPVALGDDHLKSLLNSFRGNDALLARVAWLLVMVTRC